MKKPLLIAVFLIFYFFSLAQAPPGYYNSTQGLNGEGLQQALHQIIKNHTVTTYSALWDHFFETDRKPNGKVWDIYSDNPGGNPPYQFTFFSDQCGNYSKEGDCYNREHSFPRSWFGGNVFPMYTDMHHIYPTDGFVNGKRSNYPYGDVGNATWTSLNGSKLGNSIVQGYSGVVFEPIDEYKGDLARMHFYMATRYLGEDANWPGSPSVNGAQMEEWALNMLYQWHLDDPVSEKEISRNNAIFEIQNNRNPFIDHPEFAMMIWFYINSTGDEKPYQPGFVVYPNPASDFIYVRPSTNTQPEYYTISIFDQAGRSISSEHRSSTLNRGIDISGLEQGFYLLKVLDEATQRVSVLKFVK
jgi:endonuclease I